MAIGDVQWDCDTKRPVIDGKTINPDTGELQPRGQWITYGPPTIDMTYINLHRDSQTDIWKLHRGPTGPNIDKLFIRVGKLVQDGWIKLHSVNVTQYTFVVICESTATEEEFHRAAWSNHDPRSAVLD